MAKNLIPEVCKLLGVEVGEKFKVKGNNPNPFEYFCHIDLHGEMYYWDEEKTKWSLVLNANIKYLLNGDYEIIKLPWKPKNGEGYYSFEKLDNEICVVGGTWDTRPAEIALLEKGWVFRVYEEAQAALPKVTKELGVEYELRSERRGK